MMIPSATIAPYVQGPHLPGDRRPPTSEGALFPEGKAFFCTKHHRTEAAPNLSHYRQGIYRVPTFMQSRRS